MDDLYGRIVLLMKKSDEKDVDDYAAALPALKRNSTQNDPDLFIPASGGKRSSIQWENGRRRTFFV